MTKNCGSLSATTLITNLRLVFKVINYGTTVCIPVDSESLFQCGFSRLWLFVKSTARLHFSYPLKISISAKRGMNLENSFVDPILYRYCALSSLVLYRNTVYDHLSPYSSCYLQEDVSVLATSIRNRVTKIWK